MFYKLVVHLNCRSFYKVRDKKKNTKIIEGSMNYRKLRFKKRLSKPTRYLAVIPFLQCKSTHLLWQCLEDTFSPETLSTARNLQPRHFQPPDTFSHEGERHFQPWDTFSFDNFNPETLAAPRNFQLEETFSREKLSAPNSLETLSALRQFQPWETFSLEILSASNSLETLSAPRQLQP